jgi:dipeptide/tripeptide permease
LLVEYNTLDQTVSHLNIYTQIVQYISLGFAQLFGLLASVEFAYFIAPRSAKSLFMSLYYFSRIIAEYIADAYMTYPSTTSSKLDFSVSIKIA